MNCTVDNCENRATHRYTWAWGEEGACCDAHRSHLEGQSAQLARGIVFVSLDTRKDYTPPAVRELSPEEGKLRTRLGELEATLKEKNARIGELEVRVYELESKLDDRSVIEGAPPTPPEAKRDVEVTYTPPAPAHKKKG